MYRSSTSTIPESVLRALHNRDYTFLIPNFFSEQKQIMSALFCAIQ